MMADGLTIFIHMSKLLSAEEAFKKTNESHKMVQDAYSNVLPIYTEILAEKVNDAITAGVFSVTFEMDFKSVQHKNLFMLYIRDTYGYHVSVVSPLKCRASGMDFERTITVSWEHF